MHTWHVHACVQVDDEGLPLVYNEAKIRQFWQNRYASMPVLLLRLRRVPTHLHMLMHANLGRPPAKLQVG